MFLISDFTSVLSDEIFNGFLKLCLGIDGIIYSLINWLYSVFSALATARLFDNAVYQAIVNRLYLIISVVMLFLVAYSFLMIIINPDYLTKGKFTPIKLVVNTVSSIILIILVPVIFDFAYSFQSSIIDNDIIGRLILGNSITLSNSAAQQNNNVDASTFAVDIFKCNFYYSGLLDASGTVPASKADYDADLASVEAYNDIAYFKNSLVHVQEGTVTYNFIFTGVIGIFVFYVLLIYCIDLGLRAVKLAFYQIIAPIPILLRIIPGQEKVFNSWLKDTIATLMEAVVKMAILIFGLFLLKNISLNFENIFGGYNYSVKVLNAAKLAIMMGIVLFLKQAPKLITELFGIKGDGFGLSLKKRVSESGLLAPIGALAAGFEGARTGFVAAGAAGNNRLAGLGTGLLNGLRLGGVAGWKGSLQGIGEAHGYAIDYQKAKARMDPNKKIRGWFGIQRDMLRDNFGIHSYHDDQLAFAEAEHDRIVAENNREIQRVNSKYAEKVREKENEFHFEQRKRANDSADTAGQDLKDFCKSQVLKDGYEQTTTATILRADTDSSGNVIGYTPENARITGSQIQSMKEAINEAQRKGHISAEEQAKFIKGLDEAEGRLTSDFAANAILASRKSDLSSFKDSSGAFLSRAAMVSMAGPTGDLYRSFVDHYKENYKDFGATDMDAYRAFTDVVTKIDADEIKQNASFDRKYDTYASIIKLTGENAVGVDKSGHDVSGGKIHNISSGSQILASIKQVGMAKDNLETERLREYSSTKIGIKVDGHEANMLEGQTIIANRQAATKKADEDLKLKRDALDANNDSHAMVQIRRNHSAKHNSKK